MARDRIELPTRGFSVLFWCRDYVLIGRYENESKQFTALKLVDFADSQT